MMSDHVWVARSSEIKLLGMIAFELNFYFDLIIIIITLISNSFFNNAVVSGKCALSAVYLNISSASISSAFEHYDRLIDAFSKSLFYTKQSYINTKVLIMSLT